MPYWEEKKDNWAKKYGYQKQRTPDGVIQYAGMVNGAPVIFNTQGLPATPEEEKARQKKLNETFTRILAAGRDKGE